MNGDNMASEADKQKGPEDMVVLQVKRKDRDIFDGLRIYTRETNWEIFARIVALAQANKKV